MSLCLVPVQSSEIFGNALQLNFEVESFCVCVSEISSEEDILEKGARGKEIVVLVI